MSAINRVDQLRLFGPGRISLVMALISLLTVSVCRVEAADQQKFDSPQQAMEALVAAAAENNDAALLKILGPGSDELIASGDPVADQRGRTRFTRAFKEQNRFIMEGKDQAQFLIGKKDYPFPIPVVLQADRWLFDTLAGKEEILNRRIGRNELHTIEVMKAFLDAQHEYASISHPGGSPEFAQRFASSPGKRDGLFWPVAAGEPESPFGPLIARATAEGYSGDLDNDPPEPFHGYYFKILKGQGGHAEGGSFAYVAEGKMVLGFALEAFPAQYGILGIMTFIVNQLGVIYEKDLGQDTEKVGNTMVLFDPDASWQKYLEAEGK